MRPLDCNELVELVTDYLEDAMPAAERRRFDEHLAICSGCAIYLEQMRMTLHVTGRLDPESLDPGARDALLAAFRGWRSLSAP